MSRITRRTVVTCLALLAGDATLRAQPTGDDSVLKQIAPAEAVVAHNGMVVAQEARAAAIGTDVLKNGGNAVDAAVAVGFAMAVTYPKAGNIGGGGYMVIHLADRLLPGGRGGVWGGAFAIDYRETAPAAATRDMFLDAQGDADPRKSRDSALAIGVPGTVAGLALAHAKYGSGKFTLAQLLAPAIALARDGFPIDVEADIADSLPMFQRRLARWPSSAKIFLKPDGGAPAPGDILVQRDLADTLEDIGRNGPDAFYQGAIGAKIALAVQNAGGIMTRGDLAAYKAIEYAPVRGSYRGHDILSMPLSSSGGVVLIEMLNILDGYDLGAADDATRLHLMIEAMKRGYFDRAKFLGDPASVHPPGYLITKDYAARLRGKIDTARATPAVDLGSIFSPRREGDNTTHFSVIDAAGNAVANTYTLNFSYGVGMVADGTGILLNNELDDFAAKPGVPNAFGLVGNEANAPGPAKRPLSSMTPTIVLKDGKPLLVTGSPGGSRIINAVLQVIVNTVDRKLPIAAAVGDARVHHQWSPDAVAVERAFSPALIAALEARGHVITVGPPRTSANSILVTPQGYAGAADPRTRGAKAVGY